MLIEQGDGTYLGGPLDVLCILHDQNTGKYHAAFFEEKPMPGPVPSVADTGAVRLKSKWHHTEGSPDLKVALGHLQQMSTQIKVDDRNIWADPHPWDGGLGITGIVPNWRTS